jgi:hypothetical protein
MCTVLLPLGANPTAAKKYIISYQLTPCSRILLQLVIKIFPTLLGIIRFITMSTKPTTHDTEIFHKIAGLLPKNVCTVRRLRVDSALNLCTVQTFTESEDTRCCVDTIFPPEDGHVNARNMLRIII